jgi:hypothetical protein
MERELSNYRIDIRRDRLRIFMTHDGGCAEFTYQKRAEWPLLVLLQADELDTHSARPSVRFEAWKAAIGEARRLGWF